MIDGAVSAHCPAGALVTTEAHWGLIILYMTIGTQISSQSDLMAALQCCKLQIKRFDLMSKLTEQLGNIKQDSADCSGWVDYPRPHIEGKQIRSVAIRIKVSLLGEVSQQGFPELQIWMFRIKQIQYFCSCWSKNKYLNLFVLDIFIFGIGEMLAYGAM